MQEPNAKSLDEHYQQQLYEYDQIFRCRADQMDRAILDIWLGVFAKAPEAQKFARNCLILLMHGHISEFGYLSVPFTDMRNCRLNLNVLLDNYRGIGAGELSQTNCNVPGEQAYYHAMRAISSVASAVGWEICRLCPHNAPCRDNHSAGTSNGTASVKTANLGTETLPNREYIQTTEKLVKNQCRVMPAETTLPYRSGSIGSASEAQDSCSTTTYARLPKNKGEREWCQQYSQQNNSSEEAVRIAQSSDARFAAARHNHCSFCVGLPTNIPKRNASVAATVEPNDLQVHCQRKSTSDRRPYQTNAEMQRELYNERQVGQNAVASRVNTARDMQPKPLNESSNGFSVCVRSRTNISRANERAYGGLYTEVVPPSRSTNDETKLNIPQHNIDYVVRSAPVFQISAAERANGLFAQQAAAVDCDSCVRSTTRETQERAWAGSANAAPQRIDTNRDVCRRKSTAIISVGTLPNLCIYSNTANCNQIKPKNLQATRKIPNMQQKNVASGSKTVKAEVSKVATKPLPFRSNITNSKANAPLCARWKNVQTKNSPQTPEVTGRSPNMQRNTVVASSKIKKPEQQQEPIVPSHLKYVKNIAVNCSNLRQVKTKTASSRSSKLINVATKPKSRSDLQTKTKSSSSSLTYVKANAKSSYSDLSIVDSNFSDLPIVETKAVRVIRTKAWNHLDLTNIHSETERKAVQTVTESGVRNVKASDNHLNSRNMTPKAKSSFPDLSNVEPKSSSLDLWNVETKTKSSSLDWSNVVITVKSSSLDLSNVDSIATNSSSDLSNVESKSSLWELSKKKSHLDITDIESKTDRKRAKTVIHSGVRNVKAEDKNYLHLINVKSETKSSIPDMSHVEIESSSLDLSNGETKTKSSSLDWSFVEFSARSSSLDLGNMVYIATSRSSEMSNVKSKSSQWDLSSVESIAKSQSSSLDLSNVKSLAKSSSSDVANVESMASISSPDLTIVEAQTKSSTEQKYSPKVDPKAVSGIVNESLNETENCWNLTEEIFLLRQRNKMLRLKCLIYYYRNGKMRPKPNKCRSFKIDAYRAARRIASLRSSPKYVSGFTRVKVQTGVKRFRWLVMDKWFEELLKQWLRRKLELTRKATWWYYQAALRTRPSAWRKALRTQALDNRRQLLLMQQLYMQNLKQLCARKFEENLPVSAGLISKLHNAQVQYLDDFQRVGNEEETIVSDLFSDI